MKVQCHECQGQGWVLYGPSCSNPASNCCGGCYTRDYCDVCDGHGEICHGIDDYIDRMLDCHEHFKNAPEAHKMLILNLQNEINEQAKTIAEYKRIA